MDELFDEVESGKDDGRFSLFKVAPELPGHDHYIVLPEFDMRAALDKAQSVMTPESQLPKTIVERHDLGDGNYLQVNVRSDGAGHATRVAIHADFQGRQYVISYDRMSYACHHSGDITDEQRCSDALKIREELAKGKLDRFFNDKFQLI